MRNNLACLLAGVSAANASVSAYNLADGYNDVQNPHQFMVGMIGIIASAIGGVVIIAHLCEWSNCEGVENISVSLSNPSPISGKSSLYDGYNN